VSDEVKLKKKVYRQLERVSVTDENLRKLVGLTEQANAALLGVATITKSDIVNLTLGRREPALSKTEIEELKTTHFDVVKYLSWLQAQAKSAKENGTEFSLKELFERSQGIMAGTLGPRSPRKTTKHKELSTDSVLSDNASTEMLLP
jgi:hypothetical protein